MRRLLLDFPPGRFAIFAIGATVLTIGVTCTQDDANAADTNLFARNMASAFTLVAHDINGEGFATTIEIGFVPGTGGVMVTKDGATVHPGGLDMIAMTYSLDCIDMAAATPGGGCFQAAELRFDGSDVPMSEESMTVAMANEPEKWVGETAMAFGNTRQIGLITLAALDDFGNLKAHNLAVA